MPLRLPVLVAAPFGTRATGVCGSRRGLARRALSMTFGSPIRAAMAITSWRSTSALAVSWWKSRRQLASLRRRVATVSPAARRSSRDARNHRCWPLVGCRRSSWARLTPERPTGGRRTGGPSVATRTRPGRRHTTSTTALAGTVAGRARLATPSTCDPWTWLPRRPGNQSSRPGRRYVRSRASPPEPRSGSHCRLLPRRAAFPGLVAPDRRALRPGTTGSSRRAGEAT